MSYTDYAAATWSTRPVSVDHLAGVGDHDGDGWSDALLVSNDNRESPTGIVYGPTLDVVTAVAPVSNWDWVENGGDAGDIDGDGYEDIWLTVQAESYNQSALMIFRGGPTRAVTTDDDADFTLTGPWGDGYRGFGQGMALVGDLDGDTIPDLAVSSPERENTIGIFSGPLSADQDWSDSTVVITGGPYIYGVGGMLALGDLDGDGADSLIVANLGYDDDSGPTLFEVSLPLTTPAQHMNAGGDIGSFGGDYLEGMTVNDFDNDGSDDIAVTANYGEGYASYTALVTELVGPGRWSSFWMTEYGSYTAVSSGDLDNDGCMDLFVSGAYYDFDVNATIAFVDVSR